MRCLPLVFLLTAPLCCLFTQPSFQVYGDVFPESGQSLLYRDGYFYLLGTSRAGLGKENLLLLKLDDMGQLQWVRGIGSYERDLPTQLAWQNGQLQVLGRSVEPGNTFFIDDTFLHRIDPATGLTTKSLYIGNTDRNKDEEPRALLSLSSPTSDINLCLALHEATNNEQRAYFAGLDNQGNLSSLELLRLEGYLWVHPQSLTQSPGTAFPIFATGMAYTEDKERHGFLWSPFSTDEPVASTYRVSEEWVFFKSVASLPGGQLMLIGDIGPELGDLLIVTTEESGEVLQSIRYRLPNGGRLLAGSRSVRSANGAVYFTADVDAANGQRYGAVIELQASGVMSQASRIGKVNTRTRLKDIIQMPDGRIAVAGSTQRFPSSDEDLLLLVLSTEDLSGNDCRMSPLPLQSSNISIERRVVERAPPDELMRLPDYAHFNLAAPLRRKPDLCCPPHDTLRIEVCPADTYEGQVPPFGFERLLDTAQDCGIRQWVQIDTLSTPTIRALHVERPECGKSNGRLKLEASKKSVQFSLDSLQYQEEGSFTGLSAGSYQVYLQDSLGCAGTPVALVLSEFCPVYLPSAFSPNGDGRNDLLRLFEYPGSTAQVERAQIYNRYGGLVFDYSGPAAAFRWDGRLEGQALNSDVYTCVIKIRYSDGSSGQLRQAIQLLR